jgi:hypothetical protein
VLDLIHGAEYLWGAARACYDEKAPDGEEWGYRPKRKTPGLSTRRLSAVELIVIEPTTSRVRF